MSTIKIAQPAGAGSASTMRARLARYPLTSYFLLAFIITWLPILPMSFSRNVGIGLLPYDLPDAVVSILYVVASFIGPSLAAVIVLALTEGRAGVMRLLKRCVQWRVKPRWYAVVLCANLVIWLLSYSALVGPELLSAALRHWSLLLTAFLPYVAFFIVMPSIASQYSCGRLGAAP